MRSVPPPACRPPRSSTVSTGSAVLPIVIGTRPRSCARGIRNAPARRALADDELPYALDRDRVDPVAAGGHCERADLQRLVRLERRLLVGAGAPFLAFERIDVFARRPAL